MTTDVSAYPEAQGNRLSGGLVLAALGVVYGDIGTSPLYAMRQSRIAFGETTR
jgi:KUP system potassium uptake protein